MSKFFSGHLPQEAIILTELNDDHYYTLPPSKTICIPFKMRRYYNQLIVDAADISPFESCFVPAIRCWPSVEPAGGSMTREPLSSQNTIVLGPDGVTWNFWLIDIVEHKDLIPADVDHWIQNDKYYWFNLQNLHNKEIQFWLRFTFNGPAGMNFVQ